jgi:phosphate/sulfate permease
LLEVGMVLGAIIAYIVIRLLGKKIIKPKESVKNRGLVVVKNGADEKKSRNYGFLWIAVGAALIGSAIIWSNNDPTSMDPLGPLMIGGVFFIVGLFKLITYYTQRFQ